MSDERIGIGVYGYCPECGALGINRERRPNGNDRCEAGHVYPSSKALEYRPAYKIVDGKAVPVDVPTREEKLLLDKISRLHSDLAAERKRREEAEEERNTALSALNTERTMREAAATALTEWHGGIKQGQRIIDAEAYKRLWKETKADNARLREGLEFYAARGNWIADAPHYYGASHYASKVEHDCGEIARAALNHEPEKGGR